MLLLLGSGLWLRQPVQAQDRQQYLVPVLEVARDSRGNLSAYLAAGSRLGVTAGQKVSVLGVDDSPDRERNAAEMGTGIIDSAEAARSRALFRAGEYSDIRPGDLAAVQLLPPAVLDPDLHILLTYRVLLRGAGNEPLYVFDSLWHLSPAAQQQLWQRMLAAVSDRVGELRAAMADIPIGAGYMAGSTMFDRMDSVTVRDLRSFLRFVGKYPGKYMGRSWKLNEVYATWLINNSPLAPHDLLAYWQEALQSGREEDFLRKFGSYLGNDEDYYAWCVQAEELAGKGAIRQAEELLEALKRLGRLVDDPALLGWATFYHVRITEEALEPDAVVSGYRQALEWLAGRSERGTGRVTAWLGRYYFNRQEYPAAIAWLRPAIRLLAADSANRASAHQLGLVHYRLGKSYDALENYDSAVYFYQEAAKVFIANNDNYNLEIMLDNLADLYGRQGDCARAEALTGYRLELAGLSADTLKLAEVHFDQGYLYSMYCRQPEKGISLYEQAYALYLAAGDTAAAILCRSNVGQVSWQLNLLEEAIRHHEEAIALAETTRNREKEIYSLDKLAILYKENGDPRKGLDTYLRLLDLLRSSDNKAQLADTYAGLGDIYTIARDAGKALIYYDSAIRVAQALGDEQRLAEFYRIAGDIHLEQKTFTGAIDSYDRAYRYAVAARADEDALLSLVNLGLVYDYLEEVTRSDSLYALATELAARFNYAPYRAYLNHRLAQTAMRKLDYDRADSLLQRALAVYDSLEQASRQAEVLLALAALRTEQGRFREAVKVLERAKTLAGTHNDRINLANALHRLSDLEGRFFGNLDGAWAYQKEAFRLYRETGNTWGLAGSYINMGNLYNLQADYLHAIEAYHKSDSLLALLDNERDRAVVANNIGTIYFWQGNYEEALKYFFRAIAMMEKLQIYDGSMLLYLVNAGEVYYEQGQYDSARVWLNRATSRSREIGNAGILVSGLSILGKLETSLERFAEAEKYLQEGLQISRESGLRLEAGDIAFSLGKLYYLQGDTTRAHSYLVRALTLADSLHYDKYLWEALYYQGLLARDAGRLPQAKLRLIEAVETLEKIQSKIVGGAEARKIFASGYRQVQVYAALVDVLLALGEVELAMEYLERSNAENLRSKFNQLNISFGREQDNTVLQKERELKKKLDNLEATLAREKAAATASREKLAVLEQSRTIAENEYLKFINQTINTNPELARHFSGGYHPRKLKTDKNRRLIPPDLIVLSYLPAHDKLYLFAATSDTVVAKIVQVSLDELAGHIKFIYNYASHRVGNYPHGGLREVRGQPAASTSGTADALPATGRLAGVAEKLYNWLVAPVEEEMGSKPLVAVIPTGILHFLPFQLLGTTRPDGRYEYLIERYTLFYAHTLDMLYQNQQRPAQVSILAFGNADNTLPASEQEVKTLKKLYPDSDVLVGSQATEDKVKRAPGSHNILHFATHGNLDYYDYARSYLTLAPTPTGTEDGRLTIEEVWEIENIYSYDLVTLSACSTALAGNLDSGWPVSPASSFIDAGTASVVASLWAVSDTSTALLMEYFYANLATMSKVEALRQAQIRLSNQPGYEHPYYWAPFILIGQWQ